MMLHRHFVEETTNKGMTKSKDLMNDKGNNHNELPLDEVTEEAPKKRGRKKAEK